MGASWRSRPSWTATSLRRHRRAVDRGVGGLEDRLLNINANTIATVAHRLAEFPRCAQGMREGRLSLDQVGVIAGRAAEGSDAHLRSWPRSPRSTSCAQRSSWNRAPNPMPAQNRSSPRSPRPPTSNSRYRIKLGHLDAAKFDAALQSHHDALIAQWKHDHDNGERDKGGRASDHQPPLPNTVEALMRLVESGWDAEATRRPHGHHTTVVMHLDVEERAAALHLGPLLSESERRYLTCDATYEVWFERDGQVIGAGRPPARSTAGYAVPSSTATPPARFPAAVQAAVYTHTTSGTGKTAGTPSWTTSCWCAPIIIGCTIGASSPSPDPQTA